MRHWTGDLGNSSDSCLVMLPVEAYYPSLPMSETDNNVPSRSGYNLSSTASHTGDNVIITLPESGETHPIRSELVLTTAKQETSVSIKEPQHKQSPKSFGGGFGELQGISKKNKVLKYGQKIELYNKTPPIKIKLERMVRTNKLLWTAELHRIFLKAVRKLGMESTPNAIREEMNVEGLTRDNVASHLQKYRTRVRAAKTDDEKEALLKQEEEFLSQSDDTQSFPSSPIPHSAKSSAPPATYLRAPLPQQTMPSADSFNLLNNAAPGSNQLFSGMPVAPQFSNYSPSMLPQANYLPSPQSFPRPQFLPSSQTIPPFNPNYFYNQVATAQQQQPQQPQQSQQSQQPQQPQQARQPQQRTQLYYLRQEEIKEEFKDYNYYP